MYELQSQLLTCKDLGFLDIAVFKDLNNALFEAKRLLLGLLQSTDKAIFH